MSSAAVRLLARDPSGTWAELGTVPLAAGDIRAGIDALRRQAEACGAVPVTLWLPPDQIMVRRYVLRHGSRDTAVALRRLAEDTGHRASELEVALSPAGDGELVIVLGTFKSTVAEALDYARRWGFRPTRVSTRSEAERFGATGPDFELPDPAARASGVRARQAMAAAAAMLALGLAGWGAYTLLPASEPAPVVVASAAEVRARPAAEETYVRQSSPSRVVRPEASPPVAASPMPAQLSEKLLFGTGHLLDGNAPAGATLPPELAHAAPDAPVDLALGSEAPDRRNADRPQPAEPGADPGPDTGVSSMRAGIDRVRAEDRAKNEPTDAPNPAEGDLAAAENGAEDDIVPAADHTPPIPIPRPGDSAQVETDGVKLAADEAAQEEFVEAEGSDVLPPPAGFSESRLAAVQAPRPPAKPARPTRLARVAAHRTGAAPPRVGNAAAQHGLSLDATSLIGVIDANSGREALVRMPSGDYRRVARGDDVAGWRVSLIGEDAMRLTRGDESRTLLLVTR